MKNKFETIDFSTLVGSTARLYSHNNVNEFRLGTVVFEVIEDENDGYRSSMQEVRIVSKGKVIPSSAKFLADVKIMEAEIDGYALVTPDHTWLVFGTDNTDGYYPNFVFNWQPKESKELVELKKEILK